MRCSSATRPETSARPRKPVSNSSAATAGLLSIGWRRRRSCRTSPQSRPIFAIDSLRMDAIMTSTTLSRIKLFADGADLAGIKEMAANPLIRGFTTNPTLMRKAGVSDYKAFALEVLRIVNDRPVSFEVFADEFDQMERQALEIASWGPNVNVKIPVTNTQGTFSG